MEKEREVADKDERIRKLGMHACVSMCFYVSQYVCVSAVHLPLSGRANLCGYLSENACMCERERVCARALTHILSRM